MRFGWAVCGLTSRTQHLSGSGLYEMRKPVCETWIHVSWIRQESPLTIVTMELEPYSGTWKLESRYDPVSICTIYAQCHDICADDGRVRVGRPTRPGPFTLGTNRPNSLLSSMFIALHHLSYACAASGLSKPSATSTDGQPACHSRSVS